MPVRAHEIRLIVSDVDGVWTDGKIIYAGETREIKEFNVRDGLGVKLAQKAGLRVVLISSRRSPALQRRAQELGIVELYQGSANKLDELERVVSKLGVSLEQVLYAGDDLPDLAAMMRVGISAAPADASPEVLAAATWKLESRGGTGAFRELVERLLRARGEWDALVKEFTIGKPEVRNL